MTNLGKYEILELLGSGATADVYHARDNVLGREVALKILKPALVVDEAAFRRFIQEARAAAGLFHPHIATVLDMGDAEGRYFIAMRYYPGRSLDRIIKEDGPLAWDETLRMAEQIGAALDFAHGQGFLHRDVKPSNILRTPQGEFILTDFGLTRAMMTTGLTSHTGAVLGTPSYIAPEVWEGQPAVPATDQYSLACVIYEALTGQTLFAGETPPVIMTRHVLKGAELPNEWPAGAPGSLAGALYQSLDKSPARRYASASQMVQSLQKLTAVARSPLPQPEFISPTNFADSSKLVICPNCGKAGRLGASFCQYCGARLSPMSSISISYPIAPNPIEPTREMSNNQPATNLLSPNNLQVAANSRAYSIPSTSLNSPLDEKKKKPKSPVSIVILLLFGGLTMFGSLIVIGMLASSQRQSGQETSDAQVKETLLWRVELTSTSLARETAAVQSQATKQAVLTEIESSGTLVHGPTSGALEHSSSSKISAQDAGVNLTNFVVEARLYNPYATTQGAWDYGFILRHAETNTHFRFVINSDKTWKLLNNTGDPNGMVILQESVPSLDVSENGSNLVKLIFMGDTGWFFLNGELISELDLAVRMNPGAIFIATGIYQGNAIAGYSTRYSDFSIWSLP